MALRHCPIIKPEDSAFTGQNRRKSTYRNCRRDPGPEREIFHRSEIFHLLSEIYSSPDGELMKNFVLMLAVLIALSAVMAYDKSTSPQQVPDEFRRQIGTIIVTPGNGPSLGVADFQPRAGGIDTVIGTF